MLEQRPYQQRIISKAVTAYREENATSVMIESPSGCLSGDTEVVFNIGGKSIRRTLKDAFIHFHGGDPDAKPGLCKCGCGRKTRIPTKSDRSKKQTAGIPLNFVSGHQSRGMKWTNQVFVRSMQGDRGIGLHPISNIVRSGMKDTFRLVVSNGIDQKTLVGTACHPIMTTEGWVKLGDLTSDHVAMCDNITTIKSRDVKSKPRDNHIVNLWNHPYGRRKQTTKEKRGFTIRVPEHVAVWEAHANRLTLEQYIQTMRTGDSAGLTLIDPSIHVIHHVDKNHHNNNPSNLKLMTVLEHNQLHGREDWYRNFGNSAPTLYRVVSVEHVGPQMTYDICCEAPYHNFSANGILVHNSGKTIMGLSIVKQLFEHSEELFNKSPGDVQVGWVAMRRNLLAQAEAENLKVRCPNVNYISMFSSNPPPVDILVIDEAHHDAAASCANIHNICQPKVSLGLTATPYRTDRMKLCFNKVIKDAGFHLLIEDGYLSKFDQWMIPEWSAEQVVKTFMEKPEEWGKSVMFFLTIAECQRAANLLKKQGITCDVVTGSSNREQQISDFIKGKTQVLLNVYVLCEGFDCLSEDTEVLTENGWCTRDLISPNDLVYSLNRETDQLELVPIEGIDSRPVRPDEKMLEIQSQHLNIRTTEGHEFHVKYSDPAKKGQPSDNYIVRTGKQLNSRKSPYVLPLAADMDHPGIDLSDDEIRLIGWFLTDGGWVNNKSYLYISQSENPTKHLGRIRELIQRLGMDFREEILHKSEGTFESKWDCVRFNIPKGNCKSNPRSGWVHLQSYLDKDGSPALLNMTREQFRILWEEMILGDGSRSGPNHSGWIHCGLNKKLADFISMLATIHGFASMVSQDTTPSGKPIWRVTARDKQFITSRPSDKRSSKVALVEPKPSEIVWCIKNRNSTLVTRRQGKTAIVGNCCDMKSVFVRDSSRGPTIQMAGRVLRKHPDVPVANIVQSVRTRYPFTRTASPHRQYLHQDGEWREVGESKMVQVMSRFMLERVMNAEVHLPAMLKKHKVRRFR